MNQRTGITRRLIGISLLIGCLLAGIGTSCSKKPADLKGYQRSEQVTDTVAIVMANETEAIIIQLRPDKAPITVENFQKLVGEGFYNGLTFHRVVDGFLIQGGDPLGNGQGGPGYTIKGEFSLNRISNDLNHEQGSVSMARSADYDSAGSQFFICQKAMPNLDREFAVFGMVETGMAVVDRIAAVPNSGSPNNRPGRQQVMEEVFFVEPAEEPAGD